MGQGRSANRFFGIDFSHVRHVGRRRSSQCFVSVFITRVQHFSHLLERIETTCGFDRVTTKNPTCCVCPSKSFSKSYDAKWTVVWAKLSSEQKKQEASAEVPCFDFAQDEMLSRALQEHFRLPEDFESRHLWSFCH